MQATDRHTRHTRHTRTVAIPLARLGAILLALWGTGCLTDEPQRTGDTITIHAYANANHLYEMEREVEIRPDKTIFVHRLPILTSAVIQRIEPYPVKQGKGLRLHLDRRGQNRWMAPRRQYHGHYLVFMLDGHFRTFIPVDGRTPVSIIDIPGPFDAEEADRISDNHERYKKHGEPGLKWKMLQ